MALQRKRIASFQSVSHLSNSCNSSAIGNLRYINILTWLRGFQGKLLYLVLVSLYPSVLWELRQKKLKKITTLTRKPRSHVKILIYRKWPIECQQNQTLLAKTSKTLSTSVPQNTCNVLAARYKEQYLTGWNPSIS